MRHVAKVRIKSQDIVLAALHNGHALLGGQTYACRSVSLAVACSACILQLDARAHSRGSPADLCEVLVVIHLLCFAVHDKEKLWDAYLLMCPPLRVQHE